MEAPMLKVPLVSSSGNSALVAYLRSYLPDTHCHVSLLGDTTTPTAHTPASSSSTPTFYMICGTDPLTDWSAVEALLLHQRQQRNTNHTASSSVQDSGGASRPQLLGGFGIHPWWALQGGTTAEEVKAAQEAALEKLEVKLRNFPEAAVAEIGIDTIRYNPPPPSSMGSCCSDTSDQVTSNYRGASPPPATSSESAPPPLPMITPAVIASLQWDLFEGQMTLATKYQRPVSIHVVGKGSYGQLDGYLTSIYTHNHSLFKQWKKSGTVLPIGSMYIQLPPTIVFHGYCGSTDFAKKIIKMYPPTKDVDDHAIPPVPSAPPSSPPTTRVYFGIGPNTTLRLKKVDDLIGGILAKPSSSTTTPPKVVPQGSLPPCCVLLESDTHYTWDGSSLAIPEAPQEEALVSSLLELLRVMVVPRGGDSEAASTLDLDALVVGLAYLRANTNRAFASLLRK